MSDYADMNLLEGIENFFNAIKQKCFDKEEYAAELLKARGFLLEDKGLILSDNSHKDDARYLNQLLTKENLGEVKGNEIIIFQNANVEKIFYINNFIGFEVSRGYAKSWYTFASDDFAPKIPLGILEPFVGRYVKAISACGVRTFLSCDGNHPRAMKEINVGISGTPYSVWHKILVDRCLSERFKIFKNCLLKNGDLRIKFNKINKWKVYIELNQAAEFLYKNRIKIREIRREASDEIIKVCKIKKLSKDELAKIFTDKANSLFDDILVTN